MPRPTPLVAPVTTATLPFKLMPAIVRDSLSDVLKKWPNAERTEFCAEAAMRRGPKAYYRVVALAIFPAPCRYHAVAAYCYCTLTENVTELLTDPLVSVITAFGSFATGETGFEVPGPWLPQASIASRLAIVTSPKAKLRRRRRGCNSNATHRIKTKVVPP